MELGCRTHGVRWVVGVCGWVMGGFGYCVCGTGSDHVSWRGIMLHAYSAIWGAVE